ncbi:hypothetical protein GCM10012285_27650 [Streptomyces kronopolitis]|uniref:ATP-binding protein n=1 Tax=Streptomyces kronopolitis TaxID=1612435 RepID=A0ABQ2JFI7_9ACTN|nr:hypothetical protein GCM10012285_27650 [Streptomyces kronopolitis]
MESPQNSAAAARYRAKVDVHGFTAGIGPGPERMRRPDRSPNWRSRLPELTVVLHAVHLCGRGIKDAGDYRDAGTGGVVITVELPFT